MKLDRISSEGLFMTYTGTDKIIYVVDRDGTNERTCTYYAFDEAHMSSNSKTLPPMAVTLQHAGYRKPMDDIYPEMKEILQFKRLFKIASIPTKATPHSAGYDIGSSENKDIPPHQQCLIHTGIALVIPQSHYGQLKSRSGIAIKNNVHVQTGTIGSDYRGELKVLLSNESDEVFSITQGMRVAQLIIYKLPILELEESTILPTSVRDKQGFGSIGTNEILEHVNNTKPTLSQPSAAAAAQLEVNNVQDFDYETYNIVCSSDPFQDNETITIAIKGKHKTQGLTLAPCDIYKNKVRIVAVQPGTSPRNIKQWIQCIKNAHLLKINNIPVTDIEGAKQLFRSNYQKISNSISPSPWIKRKHYIMKKGYQCSILTNCLLLPTTYNI